MQGVPQPVTYINFALTWDYYDNYLVLFGGSSEGAYYNVYGGATWTYQSGVWTQQYPLISPPGRDSSGLAFSPWDSAVVLFGGFYPGTGGYLNDTWLFKAGSWTQLHINGPTPRNGFGLVYDPSVDADVLFGGESPQCSLNVCNDTWEFHFDQWTPVKTSASPPQRWQMSMAYDANNSKVILFGGLSVSGACLSNFCGDTWQFNGTTWTQVPTNITCGTTAEGPCPAGRAPTPRNEASMAYDPVHNYVLLYGGTNATAYLGDTWTYSNGNWTELTPGASPTERATAALAFDFSPGDGFLLLLGGSPSFESSPDAIFSWSGTSWLRTAPARGVSPGPSEGSSMVYDVSDGYVVYFGGYNLTFSFLADTWTYSHGVWSDLGRLSGPTGESFGAMAYDPAGGYVLLFGGTNGFNSTWSFHAGAWTFQCGPTCAFGIHSPSPRYGVAFSYDPFDQFMIMFGGEAYEGSGVGYQLVSETWAWYVLTPTSGYWSNYTTFLGSNHPSARIYAGIAFDSYDSESVLFGGGTGAAVYGDTWTLTFLFLGWKQIGSCGGPAQPACVGGPTPTAAMVFDYDNALQGIVMADGVGGNAFSGYLNSQTYFFQGGTWTACGQYSCDAYYMGWDSFNGWGASAYDAADGYVVTSGGLDWYYNLFLGFGTYYQNPYSWVFGQPLFSQGPGFSPQEIDAGESVTFDVGATGGGIGTYSFSWSGLPTGCAPSTSAATSFTCTVQDNGFTQYGSYVESPYSYFDPSVEVIDSSGYPSAASPDAASWLGDLYVAPDQWVSLVSTASVADVGQTVYFGLNISYGVGPDNITWSELPSGCVLTMTGFLSERATCVLTTSDIGTWIPQAKVTDQTGATALSRVLQLTVLPAPTTTGVASNTVNLDAGQTLTVWVTPSGGDGPYSYVWTGVPAACLSNSPVLSCTVPASELGIYTPSVTVTDFVGSSVVGTFASHITVHSVPTATSLAVTNASHDPTVATDSGLAVTFTLTSTPGAGSDTVTWTGLPSGCSPSTSNSTVVSCSPTGLGAFAVTATVADLNGVSATSPTATLVVSPALSGGAVAASTHALDVGQAVTVSASFLGGAAPLSFVWSGLPAGCLPSDAATLSCTTSASGSYSPAVHVTDANGGTASATLAAPVAVSPQPTATALRVVNAAATPVGTITTGTQVSFELTVTPGSGTDKVTWSGLPVGCAPATSNSTTVACTPNETGTYAVSATEVDSNGGSAASPTTSLVVNAPAAATPFATPVQETELAMLAALIAIGAVALILAVRRPTSPTPPPSSPGPAQPPSAAASTAGGPDWKET